jgi:Outer membrane protein beta-barrel domain
MSKSMRIAPVALTAISTLIALAFTSSAFAGEPYIGAALSAYTDTNLNCIAGASCERAGNDSGKIVAGYMFNALPYNGFNITHGIEAMRYRIGTTKAAFAGEHGLVAGAVDTSGFSVMHKMEFNFENVAVYTRLGIGYASGTITYADPASAPRDARMSAIAPYFGSGELVPVIGLGARYCLTKNISLTADWDRLPVTYNRHDKNVNNMFSLGVLYKF